MTNNFAREEPLPERINLGCGYTMKVQEVPGGKRYFISIETPKGKLLQISHKGGKFIGPLTRKEVMSWADDLLIIF